MYVCMYLCTYGKVMFARSNSKITVTSVLMKYMLCRKEKSSVGDKRMSVLVSSLGVWDRGLMTRLVSDRPRSWSYTFGLGLGLTNFGLGLGLGLAALVLVLYFWSCLKHCCARQALCDMIMLKRNKHLYFFRAISAETVPNVTGHHITFWPFCTKLFFDNKHACCNRRVFLLCSLAVA